MSFDVALIRDSLPELLRASVLTVELAVVSLAIGCLGGIALGLSRLGGNRVLSRAAWTYSLVFRGTPLLVQLFLIYYGLGQSALLRNSPLWPVLREPFACAALALAANSAAYTSEIVRGAVAAVPVGQWEASRALGLPGSVALRKVIGPQAVLVALPAYGNEAVMMVKSTALASTITMFDLTGAARTIVADTYAPYEIFVTSGAIYLALTGCIQAGFARLERRIGRHAMRDVATPSHRGR